MRVLSKINKEHVEFKTRASNYQQVLKFATKLGSFIENLKNHCPQAMLILTNVTLPLHGEHHCVVEGGTGSVVAESKVDMWYLRNF